MPTLDEKQAFEAMRGFLTAFWERENRRSDVIRNILSWTEFEPDGGTSDPAQWHDWLDAVRQVTGE